MSEPAKKSDKDGDKPKAAYIQTGSSLPDPNAGTQAKIEEKLSPNDYIYMDTFDEDEAEQNFLISKPTCFLVTGKPGVGSTTIAKKLASTWKAELVNPTELIKQNIKDQTDLGKKAQDILMKGGAVPEDMVAKMIDIKMQSPEVAHHGYVLDGFPCLSETNFDLSQQLKMMKNWKLQPDFIINLKIADKDLRTRRIYQKTDPMSGTIYVKEMYAPDKSKKKKKDKSEQEEEEEELEEEENGNEEEEEVEETQDEFFAQVPSDVVERLVVRPEDNLTLVNESIAAYKDTILHVLEDQMANMDQSFLLELDAILSPTIQTKQLFSRLESYLISKAAKPLRMSEYVEATEGEEASGDMNGNFADAGESEEAFIALLTKRRLSKKFKWRKSKCAFYCPVSLKDGRIVPGRASYAAAFLDKVYMMADENALREFIKNPRPYLRLPQPRAPCKISVLGCERSGKTTLATMLAKKYNAKVIDINTIVEPDLKRAKLDMLEKVRGEALHQAIDQLKVKYREKLEQEKIRKEQEAIDRATAAAEAAEAAENAEGTAENAGQDDQISPIAEEPTPSPARLEKPAVVPEDKPSESPDEQNSILSDKMIHVNEEGEIVVNPEHPEIISAIEKAVAEASKLTVNLPTADYIKVLETELNNLRQERLKTDLTAPNDGGWILDNFPNNSDQLNAMVENNIIPDTLITLQDSSDESNVLMRRWYQENRGDINARIERRLAEEEARRLEEEKRLAEIKRVQLAAEMEAAAEFETDGAGEPKVDSIAPETLEELQKPLSKILEEDESKTDASKQSVDGGRKPSQAGSSSSGTLKTMSTSVKPPTPIEQVVPMRGPETQEFLNSVKATSELIRNVQNTFITVTGNDPAIIEINKKPPGDATPAPVATGASAKLGLDDIKPIEEACREAARQIERIFQHQAVDFEGVEEDEPEEGEEEEEEEAEAEDEDEEEGEEEEEDEENFDPTLKEKKVNFGDSSLFCPVTLHDKGILYPGLIDYQVKYRERIYRFANEDLKQQFIENPELYLPKAKKRLQIPAPRILFLGPKGSGKSTQARFLADKLDLFHIKFKDYLQELIVGKTKKFVEPEHEEDKQDEEEEEEVEDEEVEETDLENSQKPPKVEEVLPELTEREETIKAYLEKDEVLPNEILDEVIVQLWTLEPFKSRGFILEGFPNNENEATYMVEKGFMPDAVIILKVEDEDVVRRLMPFRVEKWRGKMNAKKEKKKQKAAKKKEKLMKRMKERRDEEIDKYEEKKKLREQEAAENGDEYEEEDDDFNVDAIIQEEFQDELQEEEEAEDSNEDEVKENIMNDLKTNYENQTNTIESIKETLQESLIPRFTIPGNRKPHIVRFLIKKRLKRFIDFRESTFERAYPVKLGAATKLIDFGYKQLSRFGRWCPVKLLENEPIPPLYDDKKKPYPAVHRSYIYFLSSKEARNQFIENPLHYLKQPSPLSVVPLRISIVGPPKSGKSTLANRFVKDYGCVRLSVGEAIRAILDNQPDSELAIEIREHLVTGKTVPDELAIQCIEKCILDVKCQLRGYVLDGFPVTRNQVKLMTERSLIPVKIIELKCETKEIMQRCIKDRTNPERLAKNLILNDSPEIIGFKLRDWKNEINFIRDWYTTEHKNWIVLDSQLSKWHVWHDAKQIAFNSIRSVQNYLHRISNHKAASIAELCVTYDEMVNRLGDFGQYCPVSLALKDELVDCSENRSMDCVAEFRGYYYKMHSAHELAIFLENPEKFVPPKAPRKLPAANLRPIKRKADDVRAPPPKPIELNGYCPVTYHEGKQRYEALQIGYIEYAAEYKSKIYFMASAEMLDKFMRKPEIYAALRLPHKLPPVKNSINVFELPMTGFLEQTVADLIKKALNEVGNYKPKFPFLTPTRSALLFVAYFLKAYNPKSSEYRRKKYRQKLTYFQEKCELIDFLYNQTTVKYKDPAKRSIEYNVKYESFFSLQDNVPTMNWLA